MRRLAGILAMVMVLTMVSVPVLAAEVETDPAKLGMSANYIIFEEDFSDNSNGWDLDADGIAEIKNGKLYLSEKDDAKAGIARLPKITYAPSGNWYMSFKLQITDCLKDDDPGFNGNVFFLMMTPPSGESGRLYGSLWHQGWLHMTDEAPDAAKQYYEAKGWAAAKNYGGTADNNTTFTSAGYNHELMYEYLFSFYPKEWVVDGTPTTYTCYDYYRRPLDGDGKPAGNGAWEKMNEARELYWKSGSFGNYTMYFSSHADNLGTTVVVDDFRMYQGAYAKLEEPVLADGSASSKGVFLYGYGGDGTYEVAKGGVKNPVADSIGKDRALTQMVAVYDKQYGYTKKIEPKNYTAIGGTWVDLSQSVSGIDTETDTVAALLWDSVETGIPLVGAKDAVNRNTAEEKDVTDTTIQVGYTTNFNEVVLSGYIGLGEKQLTASLTEKTSGKLAAAVQTSSNGVGLVETKLAIDPAQWKSKDYILRIQYGDTAATSHDVQLCTDEDVKSGIASADDVESILTNYASSEVKAQVAEEGFAELVYQNYQKLAGENAGGTDLYAIRDYLDSAVETAIAEWELISALNQELEKDIISWGNIRTLIIDTYADLLGLTESDLSELNNVSDQKSLYSAMKNGYPYSSLEGVLDGLDDAKEAAAGTTTGDTINNNNNNNGYTGGFGGGTVGGGGGNYLSGSTVGAAADAVTSEPPTPVGELIAFTDLDSVDWAEDSINALQSLGIVSGDGSGSFYPDRAVTREEFLKMAMEAAGISAADANISFADVEPGAWYYPYVAAAYQRGIVNGISDTAFGIGQKITRADMAVMMLRILRSVGVDVTIENNAFVFDDFDTIPKYARESITTLCQGGLLQGVGDNRFDGGASTTRAESAVAIERLYNYINEGR